MWSVCVIQFILLFIGLFLVLLQRLCFCLIFCVDDVVAFSNKVDVFTFGFFSFLFFLYFIVDMLTRYFLIDFFIVVRF